MGIGEPGSRDRISPKSPLKFNRSVERSSRFLSEPPSPRLNGEELPHLTSGENFNLPNHQGVSNYPKKPADAVDLAAFLTIRG